MSYASLPGFGVVQGIEIWALGHLLAESPSFGSLFLKLIVRVHFAMYTCTGGFGFLRQVLNSRV